MLHYGIESPTQQGKRLGWSQANIYSLTDFQRLLLLLAKHDHLLVLHSPCTVLPLYFNW